MPVAWSINLEWESLDSGTPEERACFAAIGIQAHGVWLTEGRDALANSLRKAPRLSAYHLSEWIAWNWWRLRWEPRSTRASEWASSHRLTTIGGGYVWPNITIFSDGERIALIAKPTDERPQTPFRYIADIAAVVQASEFEVGANAFIEQVLQRLDTEKIANTNLEKIWQGVMEERNAPVLARTRKLEALLGQEPDESDPKILERLIADSKELSNAAMEEIAADHGIEGEVTTAHELREIAKARGYDASPRDVARINSGSGLPRAGQVPAWRYGAAAAQVLREQEGLGEKELSDKQLTKMLGAEAAVLDDRKGGANISFALDENPTHSRIVLRSKWKTGRRFELARILGDRVANAASGKLFPATRAYTYRQKMQRSFAAEFLSPFNAVDEMLQGDYSMENQQEVAEHFEVSPMTIRTLLVNHRRIEREEFDEEFETVSAA
jgi:hypothetical protein